MQLSVRHRKMLGIATLALILGFLNYCLFQPDIYLLHAIGIPPHRPVIPVNDFLRHFLTGYLSDIAWCCALCLVIIVFSERKSLQNPEKRIILFLPFIIESAQYFHFIQGTFDWFDIIIYGIIIVAFSRFFPALNC